MTMPSKNRDLRVIENESAIATTANEMPASNRVLYNRRPHAFGVQS